MNDSNKEVSKCRTFRFKALQGGVMGQEHSGNLGIILIATGEYKVFFNVFHDSFKTNFIPEYQKTFYVFTDDVKIADGLDDVVAIQVEHLCWPLDTLLRFHYIIKNENIFKNNEYLAFCNINLDCQKQIKAKEVFPRKGKQETMSYVGQPWYYYQKSANCPFERDENSMAYIPADADAKYVMGALFLGETESFLNMSKKLKENIEKDLLNNKIAIWHDESHLNWYAENHKPYRLLDPSYMYPDNFDSGQWARDTHNRFTKKIAYLNKSYYLDIANIKGEAFFEKNYR